MPLFHNRTGRATRRNTNSSNGELQVRSRTTTLASATLMNKRQIRNARSKQTWQEEAWAFFDQVGEAHAATRWMGNALSRARLFIAEAPNDGGGDPAPVDNPPESAVAVLDELHSGSVGQGEMLRRLATNLDVVGEVYLVRLPKAADPTAERGDAAYRWLVCSIDEFTYSGGRSRLKLPEDGRSIDLDPEQVTIIRLWNPHPRQAWEADSPIRANLPALREVVALSQHITATVESRLAGAGLLAIPKSATLPNPNISEGSNPLHHNAFVDALTTAMITPISDRDNANAVVPIVLSMDDEAIGKVQHLTFGTELDANVTEMRQAALARFAAGTDLPQEIVLGMGESTNHWSSAEIEEMAIKLAVEPTIGVITDALTQQLLWPAMRAMGEKEPEKWCIWYSTAELSQRPDRSAEAQALYDKGVLAPESLLRENGFNSDDLPSEDEKRREFARQVVLAKPELIAPLAPYVGFEGLEDRLQEAVAPAPEPVPGEGGPMDPEQDPELGNNPDKQQPQDPRRNPGKPPRPAPGGGGGKGAPAAPKQQPAAPQQKAAARRHITAAAVADTVGSTSETGGVCMDAVELVALRALELTGKRLLSNKTGGVRGKRAAREVHAWDLHTVSPEPPPNLDKLMESAFDLVEPVLGDQPCLRRAVDTYVRGLIVSGRPHRREYLEQTVRHAGCMPASAA